MQKISDFLSSKKFMLFASFLGLYLLSTGTSWAIFSYLKEDPTFLSGDLSEIRSRINLDLPRTESCPLNGGMFTKIEKNIWEKRRPMTVVIENHADARPIEGLHKADVVYEAVAEGGITRFLAVFYCGIAAEDVRIAPIRSARIYFVDWAAEYGENPIFAHVGGANSYCPSCPNGVKPAGTIAKKVDAIAALEKLGWRYRGGNDFDTHLDIAYPVMMRDPERLGHPIASEHTMFSNTDIMAAEAIERGFGYKADGVKWDKRFKEWEFIDDKPLSSPKASKISFEFWRNKPEYDVTWKYDQSNNVYVRFHGNKKQSDLKTGEQFQAKNIVIMFVKEEVSIDEEKHNYYETIGEGEALIFQNGDVIKGEWAKKSQTSRTGFYDSKGKEISFVRGPIWIEAVPVGNEIDY